MSERKRDRNGGSEDPVRAYIKKIRKIPLLSREEEVEIARRIQKGDQEAERQLVLHNLKYVVHLSNRYKGCGLPLIDIINEGNIGLIQAAKRFDPERGVKFITYAVWWIRQSIMHALASQSSTVRLPLKQVTRLQKIHSTQSHLEKDLCREPSIDELAETLELPVEVVESILRAYRTRLTLDAPIHEGESASYLDMLEDSNLTPVEEQIIRKAMAHEVRCLLRELNPREEKILRMRFGFDGSPKTLEEIGSKLNLSRERVRQIEKKAKGQLMFRMKSRAAGHRS